MSAQPTPGVQEIWSLIAPCSRLATVVENDGPVTQCAPSSAVVHVVPENPTATHAAPVPLHHTALMGFMTPGPAVMWWNVVPSALVVIPLVVAAKQVCCEQARSLIQPLVGTTSTGVCQVGVAAAPLVSRGAMMANVRVAAMATARRVIVPDRTVSMVVPLLGSPRCCRNL